MEILLGVLRYRVGLLINWYKEYRNHIAKHVGLLINWYKEYRNHITKRVKVKRLSKDVTQLQETVTKILNDNKNKEKKS